MRIVSRHWNACARAWLAVPILLALIVPESSVAGESRSSNWATQGQRVVCGIAGAVYGTRIDPGVHAPVNGHWPGLQCMAQGMPRPSTGIGDPAVQLGEGRAGRARLVDVSQDELVSSGPYVPLEPGSTWKRDGISCAVHSTSVRCTNSSGHGFTLSPGHLHTF